MTRMPIRAQYGEAGSQADGIELLLREANHRIANSLQAVMALSRMAAPAGTADYRDLQDRLVGRVSAIASVHQLLSQSPQAGTINLKPYLQSLLRGIQDIWLGHHSVRQIDLVCADEGVSAEAASALGMITNELVTNSYKYAYSGGRTGDVRVAFVTNGGRFTLIVSDDGVGRRLPHSSAGVGRGLIARLATQLGARFRYMPAPIGTLALVTGATEALRPNARQPA